jgi:hypothetical protein
MHYIMIIMAITKPPALRPSGGQGAGSLSRPNPTPAYYLVSKDGTIRPHPVLSEVDKPNTADSRLNVPMQCNAPRDTLSQTVPFLFCVEHLTAVQCSAVQCIRNMQCRREKEVEADVL